MFSNNGYIGSSRSVRSQEAITNYEVPMTMINKNLIKEFLFNNKILFSVDELEFLEKVSVAKWKYVAKIRVGATSWHHVGKFFNKVDHYNLLEVAQKIIDDRDNLDDEYKKYKEKMKINKADEKKDFSYAVIKVQVWGGSRKHPKLLGYEEVAGIVIGEWFYYLFSNGNDVGRYKINGNKVEWINEYNSYLELVNEHKNYKNKKRMFNKLIKIKI